MSAHAPYGAVILIGFGGPRSAAEVRPFLGRVTAGRPIPRERYEEVVHHYEAIGGRSPFHEITARQATALRERPVFAGGKNSPIPRVPKKPPPPHEAPRGLWRNRARPRVGRG